MAFSQAFYNQNSILRINVMVVDDDPVFLRIMSQRLENFKHRGKIFFSSYYQKRMLFISS